ncbi:UNKNOWN [Stylonychia lemnae]|uniref:Transmembrane protein n=1 Tax=Stylonychia lemnae TaxID=5949 RepID=A0A077ZZC0_STYLE|nr:UNKNOWN [Stylonychia lemnae]|eukprot:CDW74568.1 UNKNOWN [Stylonychia lemnae]
MGKWSDSPRVGLFGLLTYGAIFGLFFHYTYNVEVKNTCTAIDSSDTASYKDGDVDASQKFQTVLMMYTWTFFIGIIREFLRTTNDKLNSDIVKGVINFFFLAELVQLAALIMMHVYRLQHSGKVCAGDYLNDDEFEKADEGNLYLISRGKFLWGWLILNWTILGLCGCLNITIFMCKKFQ